MFAALPGSLLSVLAEKKNSFGPQDHKDPWAIFYHKTTSVGTTVKKLPYRLKLLDRINLSFQFLPRQAPAMGGQGDGLLQGC